MKKVKTAFFGSSRYSLPYLESLCQNELVDLSLVVSQSDKPFGRGLELKPSPVKEWAREHHILTLTPSDLSNSLFLGALTSLPLKLAIIAYYGLKIPKGVIDLFPLGMLNIHHSLLPKHKGSNPIPWAILSGEEKTGTTIIKISEKFDDGEIVGFDEQPIEETDSTETLRSRLDSKALVLLDKILPKYVGGKINLRKQDKSENAYEPKLTRETGKIEWHKTDEEIERMIRAFTPWPGTWTTLEELASSRIFNNQFSQTKADPPREEITNSRQNKKRLKILKAHLDGDKKLVIDEVQIEGKTPIRWEEFKSGYLS